MSVSFLFNSCHKEEEVIQDPYAIELKSKLVGTWLDAKGKEQYIFESSGIVTWELIPSDVSARFKYRIQKEDGYQREYYELILEDYGDGNGGQVEIEFINDNELKMGAKTYYRKGYGPEDSNNSDNNSGGGGNNNSGNNNSGGNNSSGNSSNNSDITFHVGFANDWPTLYDSKKEQYTHQIYMGYGISKGNYKLGINEFGVCVRAVNGSVTNKNTHEDMLGNYVSTDFIDGQSTKCFTGFLYEDIAYEWGALLFVTSKDKTVTLEYTPRYYNGNTGKYIESKTETYVYTPKEIYTE